MSQNFNSFEASVSVDSTRIAQLEAELEATMASESQLTDVLRQSAIEGGDPEEIVECMSITNILQIVNGTIDLDPLLNMTMSQKKNIVTLLIFMVNNWVALSRSKGLPDLILNELKMTYDPDMDLVNLNKGVMGKKPLPVLKQINMLLATTPNLSVNAAGELLDEDDDLLIWDTSRVQEAIEHTEAPYNADNVVEERLAEMFYAFLEQGSLNKISLRHYNFFPQWIRQYGRDYAAKSENMDHVQKMDLVISYIAEIRVQYHEGSLEYILNEDLMLETMAEDVVQATKILKGMTPVLAGEVSENDLLKGYFHTLDRWSEGRCTILTNEPSVLDVSCYVSSNNEFLTSLSSRLDMLEGNNVCLVINIKRLKNRKNEKLNSVLSQIVRLCNGKSVMIRLISSVSSYFTRVAQQQTSFIAIKDFMWISYHKGLFACVVTSRAGGLPFSSGDLRGKIRSEFLDTKVQLYNSLLRSLILGPAIDTRRLRVYDEFVMKPDILPYDGTSLDEEFDVIEYDLWGGGDGDDLSSPPDGVYTDDDYYEAQDDFIGQDPDGDLEVRDDGPVPGMFQENPNLIDE